MRAFLFTAISLTSACGHTSQGPEQLRTPIGIAMYAPDGTKVLSIVVGSTAQVRGYYRYAEGDSVQFGDFEDWTSSDSTIARASDRHGEIRGLRSGTARIRILVRDKFADSLTVSVW